MQVRDRENYGEKLKTVCKKLNTSPPSFFSILLALFQITRCTTKISVAENWFLQFYKFFNESIEYFQSVQNKSPKFWNLSYSFGFNLYKLQFSKSNNQTMIQ